MHEGVGGLLRDKSRPPGKAPIAPDRVAWIVRQTQQPPPHEAAHWTLRAMAKAASVAGSTVQAIWKAHGLSPHRWRNFKLSTAEQNRSKGRRKTGPFSVMRYAVLRVVPLVHRRAPRCFA